MKVAVLFLVLLGALAAVSAAVLITALGSRSESREQTSVSAEPEIEVLLATRDLPPMSVVDTLAVTTQKIPKSQVPQNALLNPVQVVGKVLTERMVAKQPFTKGCFAREGTGVYLAAAVPPGKRAMSVQLTDWSGMAGLLYPGSVVDVIVSFKSLGNETKRDTAEMMSTTLLQGLQVMAIGSQSIADDQYRDKEAGALAQHGQINFRMVTLLVDPKQAEILQLAMQNGSISLAMRNPLDATREARRLTRAREIAPNRSLLSATESPDSALAAAPPARAEAPPAAPAKAPEPNLWEALIIRGTVSEKRSFPMPKDQQPVEKRPMPAAPVGTRSAS